TNTMSAVIVTHPQLTRAAAVKPSHSCDQANVEPSQRLDPLAIWQSRSRRRPYWHTHNDLRRGTTLPTAKICLAMSPLCVWQCRPFAWQCRRGSVDRSRRVFLPQLVGEVFAVGADFPGAVAQGLPATSSPPDPSCLHTRAITRLLAWLYHL